MAIIMIGIFCLLACGSHGGLYYHQWWNIISTFIQVLYLSTTFSYLHIGLGNVSILHRYHDVRLDIVLGFGCCNISVVFLVLKAALQQRDVIF